MKILFLENQKKLAWATWLIFFTILSILNTLPFFQGDFWLSLKDRDFANYWLAGQLIHEGKASLLFSDINTYLEQLSSYIGPLTQTRYWSYPPHYLFFMIPLGYLTYYPAFAAFMLTGLIFFLFAARVFISKLTAAHITLLLPFIFCEFMAGQNGFLTGGLFLLALGWRETKPILSGIALGLLTIKPQLGVLLPIIFLMEKRFVNILWAIGTASLLVLISVLAFGQDVWTSYIGVSLPYMKEVMWVWKGLFLILMPSLFASLRSLDVGSTTAFAVHILFSTLILVGVALYLYSKRSKKLDAPIVVILTFLLSPYFFVYDVGPLMVIAAMLVVMESQRPLQITAAAVSLLPLACFPLGVLNLPIAPLLILALLLLVLTTTNHRETPAAALS